MCSGNSLIWILSIDFFSYHKDTTATPLLYLLLLQKLEWHVRLSMLGTIRSPPRFLARHLVLKCLLKRTYVEEVRAEDEVPRFLAWCLTAAEFQEQLGTVGGEHLWASFEIVSKALLCNWLCCRFVIKSFYFLLVFIFTGANEQWIMHVPKVISPYWLQIRKSSHAAPK